MSGKYLVNSIGKLIIENVSNISEITYNSSTDIGRLVYDNLTKQLYYGCELSGGAFRTLFDIPRLSVVLFEADTAVVGYTLLTGVNDSLVYVTKGSSNQGEAGNTWKLDSTWTQPQHRHSLNSHTHSASHIHTLGSHTHTVATHNHQWFYYNPPEYNNNNGYTWASNGTTLVSYSPSTVEAIGLVTASINDGAGEVYTALGSFWTESGALSLTANDDDVTSADPGTSIPTINYTDNSAVVSTWRPQGRNYTRQRRA